MSIDLQQNMFGMLRDLHARESMRLGWYRQRYMQEEKLRMLRERKAVHEAFLKDLLRKRGMSPAWYARWFYLAGHAFGLVSALLPQKWASRTEQMLEEWILIRYEAYLNKLRLDFNLRTMIEALQLERFGHNEPGIDVLDALETFIQEEKNLIKTG